MPTATIAAKRNAPLVVEQEEFERRRNPPPVPVGSHNNSNAKDHYGNSSDDRHNPQARGKQGEGAPTAQSVTSAARANCAKKAQ